MLGSFNQLTMEKFTRSHKIHPVGLRAWTVEETKIPHRPNSAIPPPRRAVQRTVNQAYMQPIETAREEDMEPTLMEAPQTRKGPRRVTKRENINLVRECEWDVKDIKDDSPRKRTTLSKPLVFLLGAVCVTSCVSLMLTLLILFGSIEAGNCSCGDSKGKPAMTCIHLYILNLRLVAIEYPRKKKLSTFRLTNNPFCYLYLLFLLYPSLRGLEGSPLFI